MTDAFAVCGFIGHGDIGYGAVRVDVEQRAGRRRRRSRAASGAGSTQAAEAIIRVAVSGMYRRGRASSPSRYGIDPRDFTLLAFGGAGPMLGCFLARELGHAPRADPDGAGRARRRSAG